MTIEIYAYDIVDNGTKHITLDEVITVEKKQINEQREKLAKENKTETSNIHLRYREL